MKTRQLKVEVSAVDGPIDIDAWVDSYVRNVLSLESIPLPSRESNDLKREKETPLAS